MKRLIIYKGEPMVHFAVTGPSMTGWVLAAEFACRGIHLSIMGSTIVAQQFEFHEGVGAYVDIKADKLTIHLHVIVEGDTLVQIELDEVALYEDNKLVELIRSGETTRRNNHVTTTK